MDKKIALIKIIRNSDLLTNQAKVRLIEKTGIFTNEEIGQLGKLLAAETRFGQSRNNSLIKEILLLLKKLEEKLTAH